ncbi:LysR family transcriptional regulator [Lactobacillus sp.]|jgi:DNA-binding transcriptional LysR family regulator|uniref:LysR family transcriptional regulator n=1 Tax=Lactobacillus sp. TaxID=1591 RepID=UPI00345E8C9F|nr:LysR family transcriptional regulator [Lactobacillus amylovorus]
MDLNQLQIFLQVAQQSSFDRVANQNYVSQRAVSRQVKRLEEDLGVELFERKSNRILLTRAGEYFAQRIQDNIDNLNETISVMKTKDKQKVQHLRIAYFSVFDGVLVRD